MAVVERIKNAINPKENYKVKPVGFKWRSHTLFILATVGVGIFVDLFLYGLVVPILPYILEDSIGLAEDQVQSHVSGLLAAYAGASFLFSPLAGYIADTTKSRQAPYLGGLSALIVSTVMFFAGKSVAMLVIARILQGASSAFVWTVGLALCIDTVGPEHLGKTLGTIFSFVSIGELFAPVCGGVIYKASGTNGVLALVLGILFFDLAARVLVIEKKVAARYDANEPSVQGDEPNGHEDQTHSNGNEDADEESALLADGQKKDSDDFLIPNQDQLPSIIRNVPILYCLRSSSLIAAQVTGLVQATILGSFDATIPTHANDLFDFDSLKSGLIFIPLCVVNFITGPIGGWIIDRYGTKPIAVFGFAYLVPMLTLLRIPQADPYPQQVYLLAGIIALVGIGTSAIGGPSFVESGFVVDKYYKRNPDFFGKQGPYGQLYAINSMVFCLGLSVGPVLAGLLKESVGYGNMNAVLAAVSGVTAVISFIWLGGKPKVLRKAS